MTAFVALVIGLAGLVHLEQQLLGGTLMTALVHSVARIVAALVAIIGRDVVVVTDNLVSYGSTHVLIIRDCTGIDSLGLYLAAVVAFPARPREKLAGLAVGIPLLIALNMVRMVTLVFAAAWSSVALEYGHLWIWPLLLVMATIMLWLSWVQRVTRATHLLA